MTYFPHILPSSHPITKHTNNGLKTALLITGRVTGDTVAEGSRLKILPAKTSHLGALLPDLVSPSSGRSHWPH